MSAERQHYIDQVANHLDRNFAENIRDEAKHKIVAGLLFNFTLEQLEEMEKSAQDKYYLSF